MTGNQLHGSRSMPPMDRVAKNMGKDESAPAGVSARAGRSQSGRRPVSGRGWSEGTAVRREDMLWQQGEPTACGKCSLVLAGWVSST